MELALTMDTAKLQVDGKEIELPVVVGSEGEVGINVSKFRGQSGSITLDVGFANTGSCKSAITFIDGEKGILRYRGYSIEDLCAHSSFLEVSYLLIHGVLPTQAELDGFVKELKHHSLVHEDMKKFFENYPRQAHPMSVLSSMVNTLSTFYPESLARDQVDLNIMRLMAKLSTLAAFSYKKSVGQPYMYPQNSLSFPANFLHMMFAVPTEPYSISPTLERALDTLLILHAEHEQNCSTSTVRMVGSSGANLFACISAGVSAAFRSFAWWCKPGRDQHA